MREFDPGHLFYENTKPGSGGNCPWVLRLLELLDRLAALVPPPRLCRRCRAPSRGWHAYQIESAP